MALTYKNKYIFDIDYTSGYYKELSPLAINFSLIVNMVDAPDISGEFTYCELGFGKGLSLLTMATNYPNGQFYGVDFNPSHVKYANYMAKMAGLSNVKFFNLSFEEALEQEDKFPSFDYIVFHGVYTWVRKKAQKQIIKFCDKKIKTGGVIYNSYSAMPGCSQRAQLQKMIVETSHTVWGRSDDKLLQSLDIIDDFLNLDIMSHKKELISAFKPIKKQNINYLPHEYLNLAWSASYFIDIEKTFNKIGLDFVCLSDPIETFNLSVLPKNISDFIKDNFGSNMSMKEHYLDYVLSRTFRKDLYIKGKKINSSIKTKEILSKYKFIFKNMNYVLDKKITFNNISLSFDDELLELFNDKLSKGAYFNEFILDKNINSALLYLSILISNNIISIMHDDLIDIPREVDLNKILCKEHNNSNEVLQLGAFYTKDVVYVDIIDRLIYLYYTQDKTKVVDTLHDFLVNETYSSLSMKDENISVRDYLQRRYDTWLKEVYPQWKKIGVLIED
jgi:hypothetical protein